MTKHYRISTWRSDVPMAVYSLPTFEGDTVEICDEKALSHFDEVSKSPALAWDSLAIVRIDSPAVAEKNTLLKSRGD